MQERGEQAQVAGDRALQREQRERALLDLDAALVDARVVVDDELRELDVLVLERLDDAIEQGKDEVERAERAVLEIGEIVLEAPAGRASCARRGGMRRRHARARRTRRSP